MYRNTDVQGLHDLLNHRRLLRARRERPRRRAAEQRDEVAPFKVEGPPPRCAIKAADWPVRSVCPYAAHARANASVCSLGKEPDLASSRVCLPPSSLTNESSQYVCGAFVKAILTVSCSRKSVMDN
jgi:hypothetical protein